MTERERAARAICARLAAAGHHALLAGGCVRDHLLGLEPKDFDVATSALPDQVMALFRQTHAVGAAFGVILVVLPGGPVEVATFRCDGPYLDGRHPSSVRFATVEEDAARRDFTINALYLDPTTDTVIDLVDGMADLRAGILRAVGDPEARFREDHLRLLRAVRFSARLGFSIAPETYAAMCALAPRCVDTSAERVRDELLKMLTEGGARRALELLDASGMLAFMLPEITAMKGCEQPPEYHPEGDVFIHTLMLLEQLGVCTETLALSALLHDVGKPPTQTFEDRIRFNLHEKVGARMTEAICKRLKMPNDLTEKTVWLVENHMRLAVCPDMREAKRKRFVREPWFDELMQLCRIDCLASHKDTSPVDWVAEYRANLKPEEVRPTPLITGHHLLASGYTPGPLFKEILTAIEDAQLEGKLHTQAEALDYVAAYWPLTTNS